MPSSSPSPWQALFAGKKLAKKKHEEHHPDLHTHIQPQSKRAEGTARVEVKCKDVEAAVQDAVSEDAILARPAPAHIAQHASHPIGSDAIRSRPSIGVSRDDVSQETDRRRSLLIDELSYSTGGTLSGEGRVEQRFQQDMAVGQLADPSKDARLLEQANRAPSLDTGASAKMDTGETSELWNIFGRLFGTTEAGDATQVGSSAVKEEFQVTKEEDSFLGAASRLRSMLDQDSSVKDAWVEKQRDEVDRALKSASILSSSHTGSNQGEGKSDSSTANLREQTTYLSPRMPLVFCHGLFGFDTFSLAPAALADALPSFSVDYWRGIVDLLQRRGNEVLVCRVPMSASIEERAEALREMIEEKYPGRDINLIGHSMGGLDCRYLISNLKTSFRVRSLTTIATPHRGSTFADYMLDEVIGKERLPSLLNLLDKTGLPGGGRAFECLTTRSMAKFNSDTPDAESVRYFSWGAAFQPGVLHEFRIPHSIILDREVRSIQIQTLRDDLTDLFQIKGENDGLVSVTSSMWAEYKGTLVASHLDLIGWTRRLGTFKAAAVGGRKPFDPKLLYLNICEDLAQEGF